MKADLCQDKNGGFAFILSVLMESSRKCSDKDLVRFNLRRYNFYLFLFVFSLRKCALKTNPQ